MKTWTCNSFKGHYPVGVGAVVVAENIETAIIRLEEDLNLAGLPQTIKPEQLTPLPRYHRYVRILTNGEY